jgi:hypothetical protein
VRPGVSGDPIAIAREDPCITLGLQGPEVGKDASFTMPVSVGRF